MGRMIRKQIYIEPHQEKLLKRRARELGISEAEVIRRNLSNTGQVVASYPTDPSAWQRQLKFMRKRAKTLPDLKGKHSWTREDAYEERFAKFPR